MTEASWQALGLTCFFGGLFVAHIWLMYCLMWERQ